MPLAAAGEATVLTALLTGRFLSLHTGDSSAGANEVATGSYVRKSGAVFTQTGSNPTTAANNAILEFVTATADWGTLTHFGIWDAVSGGNLLAYGALGTARTIGAGDVARYLTGQVAVTAD